MKTPDGHTLRIALWSAWRTRFLCRVIPTCATCSFFLPALAVALMVGGSCATAQSAAHPAKADDTAAGNAENGKKLFAKYGCYECHGREAQGGGYNGPRLAPDPVPFSVLQSYIRHPAGELPPYTEKVVSDKDLADIYAFLR